MECIRKVQEHIEFAVCLRCTVLAVKHNLTSQDEVAQEQADKFSDFGPDMVCIVRLSTGGGSTGGCCQ